MFHGCVVLAVADDKDQGANIFNGVVIAATGSGGSDTLSVYLVFCAISRNLSSRENNQQPHSSYGSR